MKKSQVLLLAIAVVGLAGATMAFKVKVPTTFYTLNDNRTACDKPLPEIGFTTTETVTPTTILATPDLNTATSGNPLEPCWKFYLTPSI